MAPSSVCSGWTSRVSDLSTLSRRGKTLEMPPLRRTRSGPLHLLVDSTGLKLGKAGEWLSRKARHVAPPVLAQAAYRRRCRQRRDRRRRGDQEGNRRCRDGWRAARPDCRSHCLLHRRRRLRSGPGLPGRHRTSSGCRRHRAAAGERGSEWSSPRPPRPSATAICGPLQSVVEWRGRNPAATIFAPRSRRRSAATSA